MLTVARLREVLHYDPETGSWVRLVATSNSVKAGDRCGFEDKRGYIHINVDGRRYYAHRLAVFYMTGEWPPFGVDHKDTRSNRWGNLRPADQSHNNANAKRPRHNTSGVKGVSFDKSRRKYAAKIQKGYKTIHLGRYPTLEEAAAAYAKAAQEFFGQFARTQ